MATTTSRDARPEDEPVAWFFELQRALQVGDIDSAADARRELERLGVDVRFRRLRIEPSGESRERRP